jgi:divalent metal cation (Fe/Co/Zn/Cd) transporter
VLGGVGIGLSSLNALLASLPPNTLPIVLEQLIQAGHAHGGHDHSHAAASGADPIALWVSAASIAVKEWLFHASTLSPQLERS